MSLKNQLTGHEKWLVIEKLGQGLAAELGGTFRDPYANDSAARMHGQVDLADGRGVRFTLDWRDENKAEFRGVYDRYKPEESGPYNFLERGEKQPEITCSVTRGPKAITADLRRRLLPPYEELFVKVRARIANTRERDAKWEAALKRFEVHADRCRNSRHEMNLRKPLQGSLMLFDEGDQVDLKVNSLPADLALDVLAFVKARLAAKVETVETSEGLFESMTRRGLRVVWTDENGRNHEGTVDGSIDPENKRGKRLIVKVTTKDGVPWHLHWTALRVKNLKAGTQVSWLDEDGYARGGTVVGPSSEYEDSAEVRDTHGITWHEYWDVLHVVE